ncbi:RecQ family ATP-dependent DNA helicase [candidate division KSB1 bacterium]|nr:RecQ family ATP-dependent DNA helicase [candidate division KSB1 bacterium]NIR70533.1 RecQ family ATP-dependent DNA helicase [candidate division KSB1 bacterium]NIS26205.1 RecQ family ATP-dependent DNA helicase [candidate division KSB1 bacterium]NIT72984.1 RecQ family ATP-dependent DNA helicase [candidate division KSB1 bacterium]NIU26853.1 RecQ family ATP-dependent DNA helicase [candidate division KSB1 bacterium]
MPQNLKQALERYFHHSSFRPGQLQVIEHALNKRHTLVVMPTGSGKSLCYQLPAVLLPNTTLVVSPLIALMKDQVESLEIRGIPATFINSSLPQTELSARLRSLHDGRYCLIYVAPERFRSQAFLTKLANLQLDLLVVDEAHCISHWGHDFRPDYLTLRKVISQSGNPTVMALTATATVSVQEDIIRQLGLANCRKVITGFNRPNLSFEVEYTPNDASKYAQIGKLFRGKKQSAIVYTGTRRQAEEVAEFLKTVCKQKTDFYHAGLDGAERTRIQDAFMKNQTNVIVATNAFGMGVDKPDIRYVIHFSLPGSLEAYYQEAGRAGRDGKPARAVLLYAPEDRGLQEWFIENDAPSWEEFLELYGLLKEVEQDGFARISLSYIRRVTDMHETKIRVGIAELAKANILRERGDKHGMMNLQLLPIQKLDLSPILNRINTRRKYRYQLLEQIVRYAETNRCRRRFILQHFGDTGSPEAERCCDNCLSRAARKPSKTKAEGEYTEAEKTALIILHAVKHLKQSVGRRRLVEVLTGSKARVIFQVGWHRAKHYGRLQHYTQSQCFNYVDQLLKARYLKLVGSDYPVLKLTPKGEDALRHLASIPLDLKQQFTPAPPDSPLRQIGELPDTVRSTLEMFRQGLSIQEIADRRNLTLGTIYTHFGRLIEVGLVNVTAVVPPERVQRINKAIEQVGLASFKSIKERLPEEFTYDEIQCVSASWTRKQDANTGGTKSDNLSFDAELFEKLKQYRFQLAKKENLPAFVFFHDSVLRSLATRKPKSIEALYQIKGLGESKISKFGTQLLRIISTKSDLIRS